MVERRAFITGITGQDGSFLAEQLLDENFEVAGLVRRNASGHLGNIEHLRGKIKIYFGDLRSPESIALALLDFRPSEIYNLAAQSSPLASFQEKREVMEVNGIGAVNVFERARQIVPYARIYQASTSEMFGKPLKIPQNEQTPFNPRNPYAAAKEYAHRMAVIAREDRNNPQFICCGLLYNHESERRSLSFVTRKISVGVAWIAIGRKEGLPLNEIGEPVVQNGKLKLGNISSERDWGYAPIYTRGMQMMIRHDTPEDFVLATGKTHTVEDFARVSFAVVGLDYREFIERDPHFIPPVETGPLHGDYSKAKEVLGWEPEVSMEKIAEIMVQADRARFS